MNSKSIGNRINYSKEGDSVNIEIYPEQDKNKLIMLKLWVLAWSVCGIIVITQLFGNYTGSEKAMIAIYLALWGYFLLKTLDALRWNIYGKEVITVDTETLIYTQLVGKRGIPKSYLSSDIKNLKYVEESKSGFLNSITQSYWIIGGEAIQFEFEDTIKRFGFKLSKNESNQLIQLLNKYIKK